MRKINFMTMIGFQILFVIVASVAVPSTYPTTRSVVGALGSLAVFGWWVTGFAMPELYDH